MSNVVSADKQAIIEAYHAIGKVIKIFILQLVKSVRTALLLILLPLEVLRKSCFHIN
jgi:hypothetical protein